ncbi:H(+)-transporting V1 sector ATPase subunit H [Mycoemilia scoparia]|uniref:H(+)-transporting V1 sector ATPase subunit H n=1 Tax=Mycoemilia scoparia TaxID=417184 RepID=A0A9W8A1I0_9FUNG|nr:H(+)-transporting V1 sector ATPase subunit H [Mycoemilia scoparia]
MASLTSAGNTPTTSTSHSTSHSTKSKETNVPEVPLVFVTNNQFDDYTRDVFERPISVEGFRNAELINNEEYELLSKYKAARSSRNYKIEEPAAFVNILVAMLGRISRVELVLYLLVIIDELLDINPDVADAFISKLKQSPSTLYQPFLRCLRKDDKFLGLKSCKILVGFLRRSPVEEAKKFPYTKTFSFLAESLKSDKTSIQDVSIQLIRSILQVSYSRAKLFEESSNCLHELVVLFKNTEQHPNHFQGSVPASQLQYGAVLCLWLLSFDKTIASKLNK